MTAKQLIRTAVAGVALAGLALGGILLNSTRARAQDEERSRRAHDKDDEDSRIQIGFEIAPVPLNLSGKDRDLVGLGSYIVNAVVPCNDCHSAGPQTQFAKGGNPFFGQPAKVNPDTYLGGGRHFGPLVPGSADIVSRNLTPDVSGLPEGGRSFAQFVQIMRTGVDLDGLHPTCSGAPDATCVPHPFDGSLLQIMPWSTFQNMTDRDLRAIYEYLSAVPCVVGTPQNVCPE